MRLTSSTSCIIAIRSSKEKKGLLSTKTVFILIGGAVCKKTKGIGVNTKYFLGGYYYYYFLNMLSLYNFLLWVIREGSCITYNSKLI